MPHISITDTEYAAQLTAQSKTNFYYSFSMLPRDEREAMNTVYAFCRTIDDIVDENADTADVSRKRERLAMWRREVEKCYSGEASNPILLPLSKVVQRFRIPKQYFLTLIDGMEMDLVKRRYATFEELHEYCYSVASIVGLMCIEIFGYKYEETRDYAVQLGIAMQLTNILRDIKVDKEKGRIYLPQEDMELFGVQEYEILLEQPSPRLQQLLKYEAERARSYYKSARALLKKDERITMFAAEIMDAIYYRLLEKIELSNFNVFQKRITVSTPHKLLIAMRFWVENKVLTLVRSKD
jgi:phytoene synthase